MDAAFKGTKSFLLHIFDVTRRTKGGLHQQVGIFLDILDVGLEEFGQMGVPSVCHLQYEQNVINHKTQKQKLIWSHWAIASKLLYVTSEYKERAIGIFPCLANTSAMRK